MAERQPHHPRLSSSDHPGLSLTPRRPLHSRLPFNAAAKGAAACALLTQLILPSPAIPSPHSSTFSCVALGLRCYRGCGSVMAFSLVDTAARDVGWQVVGRVGREKLNLTLDNVRLSASSSSRLVIPAIDSAVHAVFEDLMGLDLRKPSAITAELPLVRSPTPVLLAIAAYVVVVWLWGSYVRRAGLKPRHDPGWLQALVVVHNSFLCCLSLYMGCGILIEARRHKYSFWGNHGNDEQVQMGIYVYIFYVSKLYEFMDTMLMLLRRNLRQITFLHLYHHTSISFVWWIISYSRPTGDAYFSAMLNSLIHVFMYLYYLLAATIAKDEKRRRKYLFWGKYLTILQMIQFVSFMGQAVHGLIYPETYPKNMPRFFFFYSLSLLLFFSNFFVSKYIRPTSKLQTKPHKSE